VSVWICHRNVDNGVLYWIPVLISFSRQQEHLSDAPDEKEKSAVEKLSISSFGRGCRVCCDRNPFEIVIHGHLSVGYTGKVSDIGMVALKKGEGDVKDIRREQIL